MAGAAAAPQSEGAPQPEVAARRERLLEGLIAYSALYGEFGRLFANWLGVHSTDAVAFVDIYNAQERGDPLSPARLAARISLSSGATTALLNRLERAGYIVRSREHDDRRIVTLRVSPRSYQPAREFFGPYLEGLDAMMARYPPEMLRQFETFLDDLRTTTQAQLADLSQERRD